VPWWAWIIVGTALLASELLLVDAEFYLVFLGAAAVLVGLTDFLGLAGPAWLEWLTFAVVAVLAMVTFRGRVYERLRGRSEEPSTLIGEIAVATEDLAPGATGRAELRGSVWTVRNEGSAPIAARERARVEGRDGLVLRVRRGD
jgi:membrane protein implicated in regulation of membrane protease activity